MSSKNKTKIDYDKMDLIGLFDEIEDINTRKFALLDLLYESMQNDAAIDIRYKTIVGIALDLAYEIADKETELKKKIEGYI